MEAAALSEPQTYWGHPVKSPAPQSCAWCALQSAGSRRWCTSVPNLEFSVISFGGIIFTTESGYKSELLPPQRIAVSSNSTDYAFSQWCGCLPCPLKGATLRVPCGGRPRPMTPQSPREQGILVLWLTCGLWSWLSGFESCLCYS